MPKARRSPTTLPPLVGAEEQAPDISDEIASPDLLGKSRARDDDPRRVSNERFHSKYPN